MDAATTNSRSSGRKEPAPDDDQALNVSSKPIKLELTHCDKHTISVGYPLSDTFLRLHPGVKIEITGPLRLTHPDKFEASCTPLRNGTVLVVQPIETTTQVNLIFRDQLRPSGSKLGVSEAVPVDDFPIRLLEGCQCKPASTTVVPVVVACAA